MNTTISNGYNNSSFIRSGRNNACPICGRTKDSDCRWKDDLVLCHTHIIDQDINVVGYVYRGVEKTGLWGQYFVKKDTTERHIKKIRPSSETEYDYPEIIKPTNKRQIGDPLPGDTYQKSVKVTRIDKGDGTKKFFQSHWDDTKWVKGLPKNLRYKIHLYQIQHSINQAAILFGLPILIVEGEGIVDLLLSLNIAATTSIGGSGSWREYGYSNYKEDLGIGDIVLCPDRDLEGLKYCEDIARDFPNSTKWLYAFPDSPLWENILNKGGLDVADWVKDYKLTKEQILAAIETKRLNVSSGKQTNKLESSNSDNGNNNDNNSSGSGDNNKKVTLARQYQQVEEVLGDRLRYNTLKRQVEIDGKAINPDRIRLRLAVDFKLQISNGDALNIVTEIAEQNSYSPIVEKLLSIHEQYGDSTLSLLDKPSTRYLGTDKPICDIYLRKFLIAMVARAINPGCKVDTALILQGKQGVGKSTFFSDLAGKEWFDDSLGQVSDKDERLKLHNHWLIEWAELETVFGRRDIASIKAFLSCSTDNIRPPYGRAVEEFNRPSLIVGTTNQDEFLNDTTGNRRFWVIPVQKIDLQLLRQERDQLLAAAYTAHLKGETWWLSEIDEQISATNTEEYQNNDPWLEDIGKYIAGKYSITAAEILSDCLHIELGRVTKREETKVTTCLRQLGWTSKQLRFDGIPKRVWYPPKK
ncbi:VapE domain-containing protein [Chlorogloea sp. CCALA 695]|uniref:VapE domain-containing protein n=1 Tax=Chlorogloea sp. CCALA 695 TaxID=2107693 RepID=UPI000D07536C|nr:VapE domain-containing protein [Chlorogloea sp. CCALA 695]PSB32260.1 hypothetical protein C7B70_10875 [Chlorogloea sp. CCALA 695]